MAEHNVQWASKDLVTETKLDQMVENGRNDVDDIHEQYLGNQDAANAFTSLCRTAKETYASVLFDEGDIESNVMGGVAGPLEYCEILERKTLTWANSAFANTNYHPFFSIEVTSKISTIGQYIRSYVTHIENKAANICNIGIVHVCKPADNGGVADLLITLSYIVHGYAITEAP